jgi:hypothetical protein
MIGSAACRGCGLWSQAQVRFCALVEHPAGASGGVTVQFAGLLAPAHLGQGTWTLESSAGGVCRGRRRALCW